MSLCVLVIQTTTLVLTMRYSRTSGVADRLYLSSTAVFLAEILKMFICLVVIRFLEASSMLGLWKLLNEEVFTKPKELLKLSIPAILYTIQNNLLFIALSLLDAATYQVLFIVCSDDTWTMVVHSSGNLSVEDFDNSYFFCFSTAKVVSTCTVGGISFADDWSCTGAGE